jgi:hypothetical protein
LLINDNVPQLVERVGIFQDAVGSEVGVNFSVLSSIPFPIYSQGQVGNQRRFADVAPAKLWHPLFWLTENLRGLHRLIIEDEGEGLEVLETEDMRAARLIFELNASGLYDSESGEWLDILATVGVDIDTQSGVDRVAAWQKGGADPALDNLTIEHFTGPLEAADPDWSLTKVLDNFDPLIEAGWAINTDSLIGTLVAIRDFLKHSSPEDLDGLDEDYSIYSSFAISLLEPADSGLLDLFRDLAGLSREELLADLNNMLRRLDAISKEWRLTPEAYEELIAKIGGQYV